jgi:two-component system CheB/CheR fusion protein
MSQEEIIEFPKPTPKNFPVAAIGASAGGLEAVTQLLNHLPAQTGIAYVYIQHLDPSHESNLAIILQRETKMPVKEAVDKIKVEPDHLYVIPPNKEMTLVDGIIAVSDRPERPYAHMPINRFFISLAERYKEYAIGIVLSGTASDGTLGLKAIKTEGGVTFAQDGSAKFQSMPKTAAEDGGVDLVLSPKQMAEELTILGQRKDYYYSVIADEKNFPGAEKDIDEESDFVNILHLVQKSVGVDFSQYKMTTIKRRIVRRMMIYKSASVKDYLQYIKQHTKEIDLLYQDLLINVTAFFRDSDSSAFVQKNILPKIFKTKTSNDPIRVWVPACSTGQEAYSLAMLIVEELGDESMNRPVQIFATDLSEHVINKARIGVYSEDEVSEIPVKRLQRFFTKTDGHYRIVKSIRDLCIFATHNISKDPPFSRLDLISCCNLLIYLDANLQRKLMQTFHYSLNNEGFLILGKSETIGSSTALFSQSDKKYKIYSKRKDGASKATFEINYNTQSTNNTNALLRPAAHQKHKADDLDLEKVVNALLLKKYSPASVIVTADLDIVQFRGSTGLYLEAAPGRASLNLMKMAKQGMAFELRNIVHKAKKTGEPAKKTGLQIKTEDKTVNITIEAVPIKSETEEEYFLIIFEQVPDAEPAINYGSVKDERVKQLEAEIATLREDMRSIVESQEAANEELQSANEEIVSSNEELQSINEELETSKEEIESSNEELTTINQELQVRNEELAEAHEYSQAVYDTIREAVLVMDKELRIKTANKAFFTTFKTTDYETVGMFFNELGNKQWDLSPLKKLVEDVLEKDTHFKDYEVDTFFPGIGQRVMLLNAKKVHQKVHGNELVLLAIEDVTNFRKAAKVLEEQDEWFKKMANNAPVAIWVTGLDMLLNFMNDTGLAYHGLTLEEARGKEWSYNAHPDDKENCEKIYHRSFDKREPFEIKYRLKRYDDEYITMISIGKPNYDAEGVFTGFIGTCTELPPPHFSLKKNNSLI